MLSVILVYTCINWFVIFGRCSAKDVHMKNPNNKLPFKCRALCISLAGASFMLTLDFVLHYIGYISAETAMWTAAGIFLVAAIYESFLLSLVVKYMFNSLKDDSNKAIN